MPKQKVPDIDFRWWVIAELSNLFSNNKIFINTDYQRGDIWTLTQKVELIESINSRYSIGVIVLYINDNDQFEILDGQQRLITIHQYINGTLDLTNSNITPYSDLDTQEKALLDAYCVYYIRLKSQDPDNKEEDIIQTFLRLQEGTPLNKAEKLNAYHGKFKDTFREIREHHPIFTFLGKEKRFRWRQLAAEMLALELEGNFKNKIFPSLDLTSMKEIVKKYEKDISQNKIKIFKANLDFLTSSLNVILTAFQPREFISFYLLASYLRKYKAHNANLINEFAEYAVEFLKNLYLFSIYDAKPPPGMKKIIFDVYKTYKLESKVMTTAESLNKRLEIMLGEYDRLNTIITKDPNRLFDVEQKRTLYFRQKGLCGYCGRKMVFSLVTGHHIIAHSKGGITANLDKSVLLHENCHKIIEKQILKGKEPVFLFSSVKTIS
jgi:uncharacterized protein with ParB-like and HNH nuclease domain